MGDIKPDNHYSIFRHNNINLIAGISRALEKKIDSIIQNQNSLNSDLYSMNDNLDALNKIYLSFHSMAGSEALARLRTLIQYYSSDSEKNKTRLDASYFLLKKIRKLLENYEHKSIEPFRAKLNDNYDEMNKHIQLRKPKPEGRFQWITFSRNNSWFISRFTDLKIIEVKEFHLHDKINSKITLETRDNEKIDAIDLMRGTEAVSKPLIGIRLNNTGNFFAADSKGKEIYSSKDFITPMKIRLDINNPLYSGRVRLFGKNHLSLVSEKS